MNGRVTTLEASAVWEKEQLVQLGDKITGCQLMVDLAGKTLKTHQVGVRAHKVALLSRDATATATAQHHANASTHRQHTTTASPSERPASGGPAKRGEAGEGGGAVRDVDGEGAGGGGTNATASRDPNSAVVNDGRG